MEQRLWSPPRSYLALALALPVAIACGGSTGSTGGDGAQPQSPLGQQMAQIGDLGDEFLKQNQEAYDGLAHLAEHVATAFETPGASPALRTKGGAQQGCLPSELTGTTMAFDSPSSRYVPTSFPGAPTDGVRFLIYDGTPTDVGSVDVSCTGLFPNVNVTVIVTVDSVVVLNLLVSNAFFAPDSFSATLSGFLSNSDGSNRIEFGQLGGFISLNPFDNTKSLDFNIGDGTFAMISHSMQPDMGSGTFASASLNVYREMSFMRLFDYWADLQSMDDGILSGGGLFTADPPLGDGYNLFVNCFRGTIDNMVVSAAGPSCASEYFEIDPTPLPPGDIAAIQDAADALFGMFNVVAGVAEVGGNVGIAIADSQLGQF